MKAETLTEKSATTLMLEKIAKYAVAITLVASAISFLSSFLMFLQWGLSYAIVATPSDIVVGGIEAFTNAIPIMILIGISWSVVDLFDIYKIEKNYLILATGISLVIFMILTWAGNSIGNIFRELEIDRFSIGSISFLLIIMIHFISSISYFIRMKYPRALLIISFVPIFLYVQILEFTAVNRHKDVLLVGKSKNCPSSEHVVWAGSSSLVTSCSAPPFDNRAAYFVVERSGQTISINSARIAQEQKR